MHLAYVHVMKCYLYTRISCNEFISWKADYLHGLAVDVTF